MHMRVNEFEVVIHGLLICKLHVIVLKISLRVKQHASSVWMGPCIRCNKPVSKHLLTLEVGFEIVARIYDELSEVDSSV